MKSHEAIETLIARATKDPDFRVRIRATKQLTAGRDLEAIAGLVQALNDSSGEVRRTALDRLGTVEIGKRSVCRELAQLVDDPDVTVKRILAERLSLCDGGVHDCSAALFTAAADLDSQVRAKAVTSMGSVFGRYRWQLPAPDGDPSPADATMTAKAAQTVLGVLNYPDPEVRVAVAESLRCLAPYADSELPKIAAAVKSPHAIIRTSAIQVLGTFGSAAREYAPSLMDGLRDSDETVRAATAETLGLIALPSPALVAALGSAMADEEDQVRGAAAVALGRFGRDAVSTVDRIVAAIPATSEPRRNAVGSR